MSKVKMPHKFYRVLELIKGGFGPMEALESEFGSDWNTLEKLYEELTDKYPDAVRAYERSCA
jgi:hypothetical protein